MIISFVGIVLMTYAQTRESGGGDEADDSGEAERMILKDNDKMAGLFGCVCILLLAACNGVVSV